MAVADLVGHEGRTPNPIVFIFTQFSAKIMPSNRLKSLSVVGSPRPPWEILDPPLHCKPNQYNCNGARMCVYNAPILNNE